MIAVNVKFKGHSCFRNQWAGFDFFKPINVIIGRNNTGKSRLLDLISHLASNSPKKAGWEMKCNGVLDQESLKQEFNQNVSEGPLPGSHWANHGVHFVGKSVTWETRNADVVTEVRMNLPDSFEMNPRRRIDESRIKTVGEARKGMIAKICLRATSPLSGKIFRHLRAERDIIPEGQVGNLDIDTHGGGATHIIRRHLHSADRAQKRDLVKRVLLSALNHVFHDDGLFTEIDAHEIDNGTWEIVLTEDKKGRIPLGLSGSGLKTVILVLLFLLVLPEIAGKKGSDYIFAFEELENNLHPALLRRLLRYIEEYVQRERSMVFLTTHSSVALDVFGTANHAQIVRVSHDGESAATETVSTHFSKQSVVTELGAKPSDLLQANGVIWVEGPSDRIYLNRWIELASGEKLREGRDYQCAFFGGSLLAREQFNSPESADSELANLLRLNANIVVVCDSDRTAESGEGSGLKNRVARVRDEVAKAGGLCWITEAKEIENYQPLAALKKVFPNATKEPGKFDRFFPSESLEKSSSFMEDVLARKSCDKVELATQLAPHMTKEEMEKRFDWKTQLDVIVSQIEKWNA